MCARELPFAGMMLFQNAVWICCVVIPMATGETCFLPNLTRLVSKCSVINRASTTQMTTL